MSRATVPPPQWLTRREAADYLGVAEQTLAVWACSGRYDLPYTRVGTRARYRRADLDAWLASRTRHANAELATA